jgi:hypothetical protein
VGHAKLHHSGTAHIQIQTSHFQSLLSLSSILLLSFLAHKMQAQCRTGTTVHMPSIPQALWVHQPGTHGTLLPLSSLQPQDFAKCFFVFISNAFRLRAMVVPPTYPTIPQQHKSLTSVLPHDAAMSLETESYCHTTPSQATQVIKPYPASTLPTPWHTSLCPANSPHHATMGHHTTTVQVLLSVLHTTMPCHAMPHCMLSPSMNGSVGRQLIICPHIHSTHMFFFLISLLTS